MRGRADVQARPKNARGQKKLSQGRMGLNYSRRHVARPCLGPRVGVDTHLMARPRREDDVEDSLLYSIFAICVTVMISHAPPRTPNHARIGVRTKSEIILTHGPAKLLSSNCLVRISATMYAFMDAPHANACVLWENCASASLFLF